MLASTASSVPGPQTVPGFLIVYLLAPLSVVACLGIARWLATFGKRLDTQDAALKMLLDEVKPAGQESLRDVVARTLTMATSNSDKLDEHLRDARVDKQALTSRLDSIIDRNVRKDVT